MGRSLCCTKVVTNTTQNNTGTGPVEQHESSNNTNTNKQHRDRSLCCVVLFVLLLLSRHSTGPSLCCVCVCYYFRANLLGLSLCCVCVCFYVCVSNDLPLGIPNLSVRVLCWDVWGLDDAVLHFKDFGFASMLIFEHSWDAAVSSQSGQGSVATDAARKEHIDVPGARMRMEMMT